jgi:hypothetical protein
MSSNNDNVCRTQQIFDLAFQKAFDNYRQTEIKRVTTGKLGSIYTIISIFYFIFIVWGILLAMKIEDKNQRIVHITFALISGPAYVLAYYLSK